MYLKYGLFDTSFNISGDYELLLRFLYKYNISTAYIPEVLLKMRNGGNSSESLFGRIKSMREDAIAWHKNGIPLAAYTIPAKILRKLPQFFHTRWFL